jgi:hypothetical protein
MRRWQIRTRNNGKHKPKTQKITCAPKPLRPPITPNVVVEWLTILLRIREVPGSNLGPGTGYPEAFHGLLQHFQANAASFLVLSNSSFTYNYSILRCVVLSYWESVVKQTTYQSINNLAWTHLRLNGYRAVKTAPSPLSNVTSRPLSLRRIIFIFLCDALAK